MQPHQTNGLSLNWAKQPARMFYLFIRPRAATSFIVFGHTNILGSLWIAIRENHCEKCRTMKPHNNRKLFARLAKPQFEEWTNGRRFLLIKYVEREKECCKTMSRAEHIWPG